MTHQDARDLIAALITFSGLFFVFGCLFGGIGFMIVSALWKLRG